MHCVVHVPHKVHSNIPITDLESEGRFPCGVGGQLEGNLGVLALFSFLTSVLVTRVCMYELCLFTELCHNDLFLWISLCVITINELFVNS